MREYWLGHCEGFTVEGAGGRIGLVEDVLRRTAGEAPAALVVRGGLLGRRLTVVPVDAVEDVRPRALCLRLRAAA